MQESIGQNPVSLIKTLSNLGIEGNLLSLIRGMQKRPISAGLGCSNHVHSQERPVSMTVLPLAPEN